MLRLILYLSIVLRAQHFPGRQSTGPRVHVASRGWQDRTIRQKEVNDAATPGQIQPG
jgi:hypothetical protein